MRKTSLRFVMPAFLGLVCLTASGVDYFVAPDGSDANPGTQGHPFATIQHAADVMQPGDVCRVGPGTYRESVVVRRSGRDGSPIRFVADPAGDVLLSGTEPIDGPWTVHEGAIYKTHVEGDFPQLFVDGRMMVEARWPNRRLPEELWDVSKWAKAGKGSRYGKMVDPELAKTGIDWTGGRATLNVAHQFYTWTRTVTEYSLGTDTFEYARDLTGITHFADKTTPWADKTIVSGTHNIVRRCSLPHSPTSGLVVTGSDNTVENCLIHDISWYGSPRDAPFRMSGMDNSDKPAEGRFRGLVINNTVYGFDNAGICFGGMPILVESNYVNLHTAPEPRKPWRNQHPLLEHQNANSRIFNNIALTVTCDNKGTAFPPGEKVGNNFLEVIPPLVNPKAHDFRPRPNSTLVDAGQIVPGITHGYPGAAPDIGAYEVGGERWVPGTTWAAQDPQNEQKHVDDI
jgi:Pel9A-like, right handed beta helix region